MIHKHAFIFILLISSGCSTQKNSCEETYLCTEVPSTYFSHLSQKIDNKGRATLPQKTWWKIWNDEQLNDLIDIALQCNPLTRLTDAHTVKATIEAQIAYSQIFPQLELDTHASQATQRLITNFFNKNSSALKELPSKYQALLQKIADSAQERLEKQKYFGVGFHFPIDLFGKAQNLHKAALERACIQQALQQQAILHLIGKVCKTYFLIQTLEQQKCLLYSQITHVASLAELSQAGINSGMLPPTAHNTIESQKLVLEQELLQLEEVTLIQKHLLSALLGEPALSLKIKRKDLSVPPLPIPTTIDLAWLYQRPDIAASLHAIRGAQHALSATKARKFPELLLSGSLGWEALSWNELFSPGTLVTKLLSMLSLPLFTGGAIKHSIDASEIDLCITEILYEQNALQAIVELANALTQYIYQKKIWVIQKNITQIAKNSLSSVEKKYNQQISRLSEKIEKEMDLLAKRSKELSLQNALLQSSVDIVIALGGGHHTEDIHTCEAPHAF